MGKMPLNKHHVRSKTFLHCFIGAIDYIGIPTLIAYLSSFIMKIEGENLIWAWIERVVFCFAIYEVLIVIIRKMQIDARRDALLALKTSYEIAALYCETGYEPILVELQQKIHEVTNTKRLNQLDVLNSYSLLQKHISEKNIAAIRYEIITIEHSMEADNLLWNYTLLLRLFK